jgi:hypothetical protein
LLIAKPISPLQEQSSEGLLINKTQYEVLLSAVC